MEPHVMKSSAPGSSVPRTGKLSNQEAFLLVIFTYFIGY